MEHNEMFEAACEYIGGCIGSRSCLDNVRTRLVAEFNISEDEAEEIVQMAYAEWMEAYE